MRSIPFRKLEATGNDYVYFGPFLHSGRADFDQRRTSEVLEWLTDHRIRKLSDRHFGIGGDGVVLIGPSALPGAHARMHMWNADGSPSAMCGNALRSVALLLARATGQRKFRIQTGDHTYVCEVSVSGQERPELRDSAEEEILEAMVSVDMGHGMFAPDMVPFAEVKATLLQSEDAQQQKPALVEVRDSDDRCWKGRIISMGNPHFVVDMAENARSGEELDTLDLDSIGPLLESHAAFPERVNVEFVERTADTEIRQRTFERGSGETLSCGSGACAAFLASRGPGQNALRIHLRGGSLDLSLDGDEIKMRGPARLVFAGEVMADF
ncbi:MAG: diaminopimelate epimerase [Leptospiraceae bacterium]|nr:diaminopimelate epimerase [Leptospiraceae bacterium]MCB1167844.1 diaminopimelate epimerase [Leptospiraceae bacterium]